MIKVEIPLKLPSLNDYIDECRNNKYAGARMKREVQDDIAIFLKKMPKLEKPVKIKFEWVEANKRRDYDNICFAKKFILDALVNSGKLKDDNRRYVCDFRDSFSYGSEYKVILTISEV